MVDATVPVQGSVLLSVNWYDRWEISDGGTRKEEFKEKERSCRNGESLLVLRADAQITPLHTNSR